MSAPPAHQPPPRRFWQHPAIRLGAVLLALAALALAFRHADLPAIGRLLAGSPALLLIPGLYLLNLMFDTAGWRRLLPAGPGRATYRVLLRLRLAIEAVGLSLPSGAVLGEGMAIYLLRTRHGIAAAPAVASLVGRRFYLLLSLSLTLATASAVGYPYLQAMSLGALHGVAWIPLAGAAFFLAAALTLRGVLAGGSAGRRLHGLLAAIPIRRLRDWLEQRLDTFLAVDRQTQAAFAGPRRAALLTTLCFLMIWLIEAVETWAFLHLLGAGLSLRQVFSFEALLAAVRALAFFVPSGLGVQDVGYLAFLRAYGVADAVTVGAAFVLVKRAKELLWILVGYGLLAVSTRHPFQHAAEERGRSPEVAGGPEPATG